MSRDFSRRNNPVASTVAWGTAAVCAGVAACPDKTVAVQEQLAEPQQPVDNWEAAIQREVDKLQAQSKGAER